MRIFESLNLKKRGKYIQEEKAMEEAEDSNQLKGSNAKKIRHDLLAKTKEENRWSSQQSTMRLLTKLEAIVATKRKGIATRKQKE
ncbi:fructose-bisphosphate aldolase, chloroplastic-like [Iris pallida]|uniref:Fructose-bisphosphate aldolase, chloroplastic-like n=1 Tax=Iris pallida TaxID=29817 RepID=A0AAX6IEN7_IRIPA|nr:fructose-bisphosphate aldolase, chloroplastic-like [Iris pallida]